MNNLELELLAQLREIKRQCEENGLDYHVLSQYLMTTQQYEDWYMNELSKYESNKSEEAYEYR